MNHIHYIEANSMSYHQLIDMKGLWCALAGRRGLDPDDHVALGRIQGSYPCGWRHGHLESPFVISISNTFRRKLGLNYDTFASRVKEPMPAELKALLHS